MEDFVTSDHKDQLKHEYGILHLIYHRNHNQHRVLIWWKYLNIIHRNIRKILKLLIDLELIKNSQKIRQKKQQILDIIKYLIKRKVFTKAYYEFNGVIALGQFVTLGLALLGNLSKIYCILRSFKGVDMICKPNIIDEAPVIYSEQSGNDDLGEIIDLDKGSEYLQLKRKFAEDESKGTKETGINEIDDIFSTKKMKTKSKKKIGHVDTMDDIFKNLKCSEDKKKKKKKKRNEIDDIFNF